MESDFIRVSNRIYIMNESMISILTKDLESIYEGVNPSWTAFDHSRLFITGGTGFFGRWLLRSFRYVCDTYGIKMQVVVLTRDPELFRVSEPELYRCDHFTFIKGDISNFEFPRGHFDYVIHAAADSSNQVLKADPITMCKSIVNGMQRVLDFASNLPSTRLLFVSSGATYGGAHPDFEKIPEACPGRPIDLLDIKKAYTETKRMSEMLCTVYGHQKDVRTTIARCFSFIGPGLALDANYAIGNFIRNVLEGKKVLVTGSGLEKRSYLYTSDLIVWLLTLLVKGDDGTIVNVGSEEAFSIGEVAKIVSEVLGGNGVEQSEEAKAVPSGDGYVPSVKLARERYNLQQTVSLEEGIRRTAAYAGWRDGGCDNRTTFTDFVQE